jgi:Holliday junction resolvasome RuvABC endonuclease subunit
LIFGIDTALQNSALVGVDKHSCVAFKPFLRADGIKFRDTERINVVTNYLLGRMQDYSPIKMVALEDNLMTGRATNYETAELLGVLKRELFRVKIPYILVHPSKTHKYVVKRKKVEKEEIISYVGLHQPEVLRGFPVKDQTDVADSWVIAQVGLMVYRLLNGMGSNFTIHNKPPYTGAMKEALVELCRQFKFEERWIELLLTDGSGILTKQGLCWLP